jgi:transcriptional regulator with XRE-family HTH domain
VKVQAHFGSALKRLRGEREITQEELAFGADLSVVYLRGLEAGRYNPTLNVLFDIGKALDVHPVEMLREIPLDAETRDRQRKRPGPPEGTVRGPK